MNCPRCFLPLRKELYEKTEVDFCDTCWGMWLDKGELPAVVHAEDLVFDEEDRKRVLDLYSASKPGPRGAVELSAFTRPARRRAGGSLPRSAARSEMHSRG